MSEWMLGIVGFCYLATAVDLAMRGSMGLSLAFLCYAGANFGLIMEIIRVSK